LGKNDKRKINELNIMNCTKINVLNSNIISWA
jgi:hypothetical protein